MPQQREGAASTRPAHTIRNCRVYLDRDGPDAPARAEGDAGAAPARPPAIKGFRIDQGQIHAEKRSNHVHSPLIGG
ncbi:hypothetical protein K1W54_32410, partial [Micromonospora sp. CPCC 205371]|nr:hypothetical protein [Micromonospora sp. CPCC 205371]